MKIDYRRIAFFLGAAIVSAWCGWKGQPLIHLSSDARSMITDVFAILAGFLMTVLTLVMEPKADARVWRETAAKRSNFVNRIVRYKWLFMLYLVVLGFVFLGNLIGDSKDSSLDASLVWVERIYLSLATLAFIVSLTLPNRLMQLQVDRYDEVIRDQKKPD
ncbi:hypothetical protein [Pseudomonas sp. Irchel s3a10]|jgi:hypothetical protein|uniref:hypothetical protein n=1 Tax=Pseudomonas sp. Irchel s3a10 TaxID=2009045 RepID=UPI000BA30A15|nr:hypothetical protein [Pseudomonas sp. Irchel s3a10]